MKEFIEITDEGENIRIKGQFVIPAEDLANDVWLDKLKGGKRDEN